MTDVTQVRACPDCGERAGPWTVWLTREEWERYRALLAALEGDGG